MKTNTEMRVIDAQNKFAELLSSTKIEGVMDLLSYLEKIDFFNCPSSVNYHGNHKGGLVLHSVNVYNTYMIIMAVNGVKLNENDTKDIILATLLHDVCKAPLYSHNEDYTTFGYNYGVSGHGKLSVEMIEKFIKISDRCKQMILYHMGYYYANETNMKGEYGINQLKTAQNDIFVKLMYFSDDISAQLLEETI